MKTNKVVVFDGVCKLCTWSVRFILRHDHRQAFLFATNQSETGSGLLREYGIRAADRETILLVKDGKAFTESDAVFEIISEFRPAWKILLVFRHVPRGMRDFVYRIVAKNRYRLFGKKDQCMIPSPEIEARFIDY